MVVKDGFRLWGGAPFRADTGGWGISPAVFIAPLFYAGCRGSALRSVFEFLNEATGAGGPSDAVLRRRFNGDDNDMLADQRQRAIGRRRTSSAVVHQQTVTQRERSALVPCFTTGTGIATARGVVLVEDLVRGDMIVTRDNGLQELRWVGQKPISHQALAANPELAPIRIKAGAFGDGLPAQDIVVSPNHRMLIAGPGLARSFAETEMLVAAKYLLDRDGVDQVATAQVTYHHFMFDRHEVVLANGAWTESFQPADGSLKAIDADQRAELFAIFPTLENEVTLCGFDAARRSLRASEVELLAASF